MNFTTQIPIPKTQTPIDYNSKIVSLGSCFAENMAEKFEYFKFQNTINPFGIIFNPVSIERLIERVANDQAFTEKDIFFHNESWHCYQVHSDWSTASKDELLESLNTILKRTKQNISEASHIIITYGTSWIYRNIESKEIVANCHKVPQKQFCKELLSVAIIAESIAKTLEFIHAINPNCSVIFTISPVRHIKDGFVENQVSKANLIAATYYQLLQTANNKLNTTYFPSYEIMMDELRDYRFYAEDMLHPSQVGIDYIWERFLETQITASIYLIMNEVCSIQKGLAHRPFNPNSKSHQKFLLQLQNKMDELQKQLPTIHF
jgi:lysophospholipase L1-like esterase